jgi:hypothetical protein
LRIEPVSTRRMLSLAMVIVKRKLQ